MINAISIKSLARFSKHKIRDLQACLNKFGCIFWPSDSKMRNVEVVGTRHVGESVVDNGLMAMFGNI